jgi:hypothetical protein
MAVKALVRGTIVVIALLLLAACGNETWVERLEVTLHDDLSGRIRFIILESEDDAQAEASSGGTPFIDTIRNDWVAPCNVPTIPYQAHQDARGFQATADFSDKGDIEYAFACVPILGQVVKPHPLQITEGFLWDTYELQIELLTPYLFREVQLRLPGRLEEPQLDALAASMVTVQRVSGDTMLWRIAPPVRAAEATSQPGSTSVAAQSDRQPFTIVARSKKWKVTRELVFSLLSLVFGSGLVWQLAQRRRRSER